jgi:hypothetical protein
MTLDVVDKETGDLLLTAGGRWDRRRKSYVPASERRGVEVFCNPAQTEAVEWFDDWLDAHKRGVKVPDEDRIFSVVLSGGQRGGKTFVGVRVFPLAYALTIPGSYTWIVCPSKDDFEEVEDYLEGLIPKAWYTKKTFKSVRRYNLANGARIVLRSAHNPESLKKGRCDLVVMNEAQQMKEKAFAVCRARIADKGGVVIGCANPPTQPIGEWVGNWVAEAESGERQAIHFYFDPFRNPDIDHAALRALAKELDPRTYEIEVLGKFLSVGDTVLYNWDRLENEVTFAKLAEQLAKLAGLESLELRDITREVTNQIEGRAFDRVLGVDVQKYPHMACIELRFFENPLALISDGGDAWWKWSIAVITDEVILEGADEFDLVREWEEKEWDPEETLIVCDASAKWQFSEQDPAKVKKLRELVRGRGSWDVFKNGGYRHIRNPDRNMEKNPDRIERCRATTARICTKEAGPYGQRFLYSLSSCRRTNRAIRGWPNRHGKPSSDTRHAHIGDGLTYAIGRCYTRRARKKRKPFSYHSVGSTTARERDIGRI